MSRSREITLLTLIMIALGLAWRSIRYGLNFPLWGDEAFLATSFFVRDFRGMIDPLEYGQIAPLGFMWCQLAITHVLGLSEQVLRLFPYLGGLVTVLLYWQFSRRVLGRRSALLAVGMFGAAYFPMRYGAELKPYGLDLLISLVLTCAGWSVITQLGNVWRWMALVCLAGVSVWFSYPSVFVSGAVGMALLYRLARIRTTGLLVGWLSFSVVLTASFLAMLHLYAKPHLENASWLLELRMWTSAFPPIWEPLKFLWWLIDTHTGELLAYPAGGKHGASLIPCILVTIGTIKMWRKNRTLAILLLGPLVLTFVAAVMHRYPYGGGPRVSLYMAPAFCLLGGVGLGSLLKRFVKRRSLPQAIRVSVAVFVFIALVGMARDILRPYKSKAAVVNRSIIRDLALQAAPDDRWVTFNSIREVSYAPSLALWGGTGARFRYYLSLLSPVPLTWSPPPDELDASYPGLLWLYAYKDNNVPFPQAQFDAYIKVLTARLGKPQRKVFVLEGPEAIELYAFPKRPRNP